MALLTAAVGASGAALGLATLGNLTCLSGEETEAVTAVSSDACAKTIGVAVCLPADGWRKASRHVTLIGELLVISRRPGSADSSFQLGGTRVEVDDCVVRIVSFSGAVLATFWLNSPLEAARWAKELDLSATTMPKMLSLNRQQMEKIRAEQAFWEEKISRAKDSKVHQDRLLVEVAEKEQRLSELASDIESFKVLPKTLSLDRHQIEELEQVAKDKENHISALQGQLDAFQTMPKMISLNRKQVAQLEQKAMAEEGKVADLQQELEAFQEKQKALALENQRVAELKAQQGQKDSIIDSLGSRITQFRELPKMLSVRRVQVEKKEAEWDARIAELEKQVSQAAKLPKMLSLNRRQAHEMVQQAAAREAELAKMRREVLHRRAQEMLRPRIISTTTSSVYEGPAVFKKVVTKPLSSVQEKQPWSPSSEAFVGA
jgi:septal ring factor EnvC (AmiA/AmiB activator)